mmetsp:Transcript_5930/g.16628  ORF Transcript_5930/g.16628 Transcript_5930/m.16628 type:complete len:899 (+) Transcript_5930:159-2855(+)|eukprot:CAMPEP_0168738126 /NCGR_PEP_ID=MMETSP0724-20121128/10766_1 /TAXON_ID=265536 /ORGANISM="Amphiprora sp., Strain CCMP467" /LENGTH=898 /DNA_ID=CAMNT_0008785447 /DNA_START=111 /DNA_END=2807 /DNA_ORIENTATION=-
MEPSSKIPRSSHTALEVPMDLNKQLLNNLNFSPSDLPTDLAPLWKAVFATVAPTESTGAVQEADEEVEESVTKELQQITSLLKKPGEGGGVGDDVDVSGDDVDGSGDERGGDGGGETKQSGDSAEDIVQFILGTTYKRFPHYAKIFITASGGKGDTAGMEPMEFDGTKHDEHKLQFGRKLKYNPVTKLAVMIVPGQGQKVVEFEVGPPFEKTIINNLINTPALQEITKFLGRTSEKVLSTKQEYGLTIPNIDSSFVSVNYHSENQQHPLLSRKQPDKDFALVVAGESGSGKSVYSVNEPLRYGYNVLYLAFQKEDFQDDRGNVKRCPKLKPEERCWLDYVQLVVDRYDQEQVDREPLFRLKSVLNSHRNGWAKTVRDKALERVSAGAEGQAKTWLSGKSSSQVEKLAIVLDEATDLDLANGLVDTCRDFATEKRELSKELPLVIVSGTGLDAIRTGGHVGTNPSKCFLVTITGPKQSIIAEALKSHERFGAAVRASPGGVFSRILMTNARMYFRGVLPVLGLEFLKVQVPDESEVQEILVQAGSSHVLMSYAVRKYLISNSIQYLDSDDRKALLEQAFTYHLHKSLSGASKSLCPPLKHRIEGLITDVTEMPAFKAIKKNGEKIFEKGLARCEGTSKALKYLACFGLTDSLERANGYKFEHITSLHVERFMMTKGYKVWKHKLKFAWPPKKTGNSTYTTATLIPKLKETLESQKEHEQKNLRKLLQRMDANTGDGGLFHEDSKVCVIFSQGTLTAQGGDVLVLCWDGESMKLISIQCKHFSKWEDKINKGWLSLGVPIKGFVGKARYSDTGLLELCSTIQKSFERGEVSVGKRVLALSLPANELKKLVIPTEDADGKQVEVEVWPKEWFEPTISVMDVNEEEEDDDDDHQNDGDDVRQ